MTCLEAQSKIIAYIDYKLEREEKEAFLKHIETCDNCREELNIYYTMIVGMRQLDDDGELSKDFTQVLNERMLHERKATRKTRGILRSSIFVLTLIGIGIAIISYVDFLDVLRQKEQVQLKEKQGDYYYSEYFSEYMFRPDQPVIQINIEEPVSEPSFYERIRNYNALKK